MSTTNKPKFQLYKERNFSQKFDATFAFVQENWRPLCKYLLMFIAPICIVSGVSFSNFMIQTVDTSGMTGGYGEDRLISYVVNYGFTVLTSVLAGWVSVSMIYTLMQRYAESPERLRGTTWTDLKPLFFRALRREAAILGLYIVMGLALIAVIIATIAALQLAGLLLTLAYLIAYCVIILPLMLAMPIAVFEQTSPLQAVAKAWRLGFATWGSMFGFTAVVTIIISVMTSLLSTPVSIVLIVQGIFFDYSDSASAFSSPTLMVSVYLLSVVTMTVNYLLSSVFHVAIAVQYGHAAERVDGVATGRDIASFESISSDNTDGPSAPLSADDEISSFEQL